MNGPGEAEEITRWAKLVRLKTRRDKVVLAASLACASGIAALVVWAVHWLFTCGCVGS